MHVWMNRIIIAVWLTFADSLTSYIFFQHNICKNEIPSRHI